MADRQTELKHTLTRVDGQAPGTGLGKHRKMTTSPFVFYRGSAPLFYRDLASGRLSLPDSLLNAPMTTVMGDCHTSNFGFFSEEGSHGDRIIFGPNDFDDACIGYAGWDLLRYLVSVYLTVDHCQGRQQGRYAGEDDISHRPVVEFSHAEQACERFLDSYVKTCHKLVDGDWSFDKALEGFKDKHILSKRYNKALARAFGGGDFEEKSALGKAVDVSRWPLRFRDRPERFNTLSDQEKNTLIQAFAPYVDDTIVDVTQRLDAGTGSVNMRRFYLLVGPAHGAVYKDVALSHIVEVKQQRAAAPLHDFPDLNPSNRLNPAHLTVMCQRRMQRNPDLVLDEVVWDRAHWLVRSRHHAKVGVDPEHIGLGKKAVKKGLRQYGKSCGQALALAHARGDRRSHRFEQTMAKALPAVKEELIQRAQAYFEQVVADHHQLCQWENASV